MVTILTEKLLTKHKYKNKVADTHYKTHIILYIIFKAEKIIVFKLYPKKQFTTVTQPMLDGIESLLC